MEKDTSVKDRLKRFERMYNEEGIRRTVDGILLVHQHGHPHVLLLQIGNTFFKLYDFALRLPTAISSSNSQFHLHRPGGKIKPHESEIEGLKRKLTTKLAPAVNIEGYPTWEVGELVSVWWRPNYETLFVRTCTFPC